MNFAKKMNLIDLLANLFEKNSAEKAVVLCAMNIAKEYHAGQKYGEADYFEAHLARVAEAAARWVKDAKEVKKIAALKGWHRDAIAAVIVAAALLHDLKEDTVVKTRVAFQGVVNDAGDDFGCEAHNKNAYCAQFNMVYDVIDLLDKKEQMYDEYMVNLTNFADLTEYQTAVKLCAIVGKLFDSQINYLSCMEMGDTKWALKYLKNIQTLHSVLAEQL